MRDRKLEQILSKVDKSIADDIRNYIVRKRINDYIFDLTSMTIGYIISLLMTHYIFK